MAVYDFNQQEYNLKLAEALKKISELKQPEWISFVKSGAGRERPIDDPDFWYKRTASILKQIYKKGNVGVSRLRTYYGNRKNRGYKPEEFRKSGGKIIRTILQQTDKIGFTEIVREKNKKEFGRKLSEKGRIFLESVK
ncbi:MAG: 40S ribosomal protein S19 [Nanoarchaeota archaeon]